MTDADARVEMLELALSGETDFELCLAEIERGGASYTIETLDELQARDETAELWFITGSDAFLEIRTWKDWRVLLEGYAFAVHERPGVGVEAAAAVVPESYRERIVFLTRDMLDISSTEIRGLARAGRSIRFLVPQAVDDYVRRNHLYQ